MPFMDFEDTQKQDEVMLIDINNNRDAFRQDSGGTRNFSWTKDGFMDTTSGWKYRFNPVNLGDLAANSDAFSYPLLRFPVDITITGIEISVDETVASDTTDYQTIEFFRLCWLFLR